mgnify:FL=1
MNFLFIVNLCNSFLIGICISLYHIYNPDFSSISFLTLLFPVFYIVNIFFLIYWLLKLDLRLFLSLIILLLLFYNSLSVYNINNQSLEKKGLNFMSFNARLFNHYNWIEDDDLTEKTEDFFKKNMPDLLAIQEYHKDYEYLFKEFKYQHIFLSNKNSGKSIFSNSQIVDKGIVGFENSNFNAIYADIVFNGDTIRVYNAHFESFKFDLNKEFNQKSILNMIKKYKNTYKFQKDQSDVLLNHIKKSPFKVILAIDMNNTEHSFVYKQIKEKLNDTFVFSGNGFGSTYWFNLMPFRIDYIFVSPSILSNNFEIYSDKISDHKVINVFLNI